MKQATHAHPCAAAMLLAAAALPLTPAFAQDAAPPPIVATQALPAAAPAPVATPAPTFAAPTPVVQNVPPPGPRAPVADTTTAEAAPPARRPARAAAPRPATARAAVAVTRAVAAPAPVATPVAAAPLPTPAPVAEPIAAPAPVSEPIEVTTETTETAQPSGNGAWLWIGAGLIALLGLIGFFALRRRNHDEFYDEVYEEQPVYAEPIPVAAAAPVIAPVSAERPQVELGMRPVRAGTDGDDAVVEFELTVENSSGVDARDIRVSTWMLTDGGSEAERTLIVPPAEAELTRMSLSAGSAKRIDVSLALPRADVHVRNGDGRLGFTPVVVADARYPLPNGGEGRISASFAVGVTDAGGEITPFPIDDVEGLHEDIGAQLHGELERA